MTTKKSPTTTPSSPSSPPSSKNDAKANNNQHWSIFPQETVDLFTSPQKASSSSVAPRRSQQIINGSDDDNDNDDVSVNISVDGIETTTTMVMEETTSLLASTTPAKKSNTGRGGGGNTNTNTAANNKKSPTTPSSPARSPSSSSKKDTNTDNNYHWSDRFTSPHKALSVARQTYDDDIDNSILVDDDDVSVDDVTINDIETAIVVDETTSLLATTTTKTTMPNKENNSDSHHRTDDDDDCVPQKRNESFTLSSSSSYGNYHHRRCRRPTTSNTCCFILKSMMYWDVYLPPVKKHVVNGILVESFRASLYKNTNHLAFPERRITFELYGPSQNNNKENNKERRKNRRRHPLLDIDILEEKDIVVVRIMKSRTVRRLLADDGDDVDKDTLYKQQEIQQDRNWESQSMSDQTMSWMMGINEDENNGDTSSCTTCCFSTTTTQKGRQSASTSKKNNDILQQLAHTTIQWEEVSRTKFSELELVSHQLNEIDLKMGVGIDTVVQTFGFKEEEEEEGNEEKDTDDQHDDHDEDDSADAKAKTFVKLFELLNRLKKERAQHLAAVYTRSLLLEEEKEKEKRRKKPNTTTSDTCKDDNVETERHHQDSNDYDSDDEKYHISILIEIVSASNIPSPDEYMNEPLSFRGNDFFVPAPVVAPTSNPYVVVRDGKKDIHTTAVISDTVNPVWTLSNGSLFLLESESNNLIDFFERSNIIEFTIKNRHTTMGVEHEIIGTVIIHKTDLLNGLGRRTDYQILRPPRTTTNKIRMSMQTCVTKTPYLYLRYRPASHNDIDFMKTFQKLNKDTVTGGWARGIYADNAFLAPKLHPNPFLQRSTRKVKNQPIQYRVKPSSDPNNVPGTQWMTKTEIEDMAMMDHSSTSWIQAGSGSIGKLYIEIIGCDGLTNLARAIGDKSDPFVCIVYEDCIVNTDVINDCLSPRWMPWSQRGFVLKMMHPCSQIFIGVFDFNKGSITEPNHDPLGRAVINITNLRPGTINTMSYNLYDSDDIDRTLKGSITIRLRIDIDNERRALLSELTLKDHYYVSTMERPDFKCVSNSITNDNHHQSLSLKNLTNYAKEILQYLEILDHITDALTVVILWRGHYPMKLRLLLFCGRPIVFHLPLHSIVAFVWATILAYDFEKFFSFFFFFIGWVFLATMECKRKHPSLWRRPRSYGELLSVLLFNDSFIRPRMIDSKENIDEIDRYESDLVERAKAKHEAIERSNFEKQKQQKRLAEEEGGTGGGDGTQQKNLMDITTKAKNDGSSDMMLAPFKSILMPIQEILYKVCVILRVVSSIVLWRDSYAAFWIVTSSFITSFVVFWIPWAIIIKWWFTIFVWTIFGPWMKLVDIYYVQRKQNTTEEERTAKMEADYERRYNLILGEWSATRIRKENAAKIMDMKRYMFGQFLMRVPILKEERFPYEPAFTSSSMPLLRRRESSSSSSSFRRHGKDGGNEDNGETSARHYNDIKIVRHINGQHLSGDMVPFREKNNCDDEHDSMPLT